MESHTGTLLCFCAFHHKNIFFDALHLPETEPQYEVDGIQVTNIEYDNKTLYTAVTRNVNGRSGQLQIVKTLSQHIQGRVLIVDRTLRESDFQTHQVDFLPNYYIIDSVEALENGLDTSFDTEQKRKIQSRILPPRSMVQQQPIRRFVQIHRHPGYYMSGNPFMQMITATMNGVDQEHGTTVHFFPQLNENTLEQVLHTSFHHPQPAAPEKRTLSDVWKEQVETKDEQQEKKIKSTCVVCMDAPACMVFVPCGCLVSCQACVKQNWEMKDAVHKCFICRELVSMPIHISQWKKMQEKIEKNLQTT